MENSNYKLQKIEAISIIVIIMLNKLILNVPYIVISTVGTGIIVNLIYIGIVDLLFSILLIKLFEKFQNADIIDISEYLGGKILKWIIGIISILLFIFVAFVTLVDFTNALQIVYFSNFSIIYIVLFFIVGILVANLYGGLKGISHFSSFLLPFVLISIILPIWGVWSDFSIESFTPFFGNSYYSTFVLGLSNCFSMYIISYFYFFKPHLKETINFKKVVITSYGISWFLLFLSIIPIMTLFNVNMESEPLNSLYLLSRKVEFGSFIQRTDALFILLWLLSLFTYLSFVVFLINRTLKKLLNVTNEKMISFSICNILLGLAILPLNSAQIHLLEKGLYKYIILIVVFGLEMIVLLLANLKFKLKGNNQS